jgi:limonene-1,2-epoxide hydrolase
VNAQSPLSLIADFCAAWGKGDLDNIMSFFADDAVYHNIPVDPVTGIDAIRSTIEGFTGGVDSVEFQVRHIVADGDIVMTERVDVFKTSAKTISLPVMGVFEVAGGKIAAWRDYFDMNQFMSQLA